MQSCLSNCRSRAHYGLQRARVTGRISTWQRTQVNAFHTWLSAFTTLRPLTKSQGLLDIQLSVLIILYGIWTLIWEYRQLNSVSKLQSVEPRWNGALMSSSWHQELCNL